MPSILQAASLVGALVASVHAHGHLSDIKVDGQDYTAYDPSFQFQNPEPQVIEWACKECLDNGFVDPTMYDDVNKISCHKDAIAGAKVAKVKAGGTVDIQWNTWPESHVGPVLDYLAKVDDATKAKAGDLEFFKIDAAGFENNQWAASKLIAQNLTWHVTIPDSIAPGNYVLRHEIIALHSAGQLNGAQNYPKCINLEVEGTGTATPKGVTGDKLYKATDPGIEVNVYGDNSKYQMPGPPLFSGASSGSDSAPSAGNSTSAAPAPAASTPASSPVASSAPAASTAAAVNAVASSTPSAAPAQGSDAGALPKEFTIETFIAWLEEKTGVSTGSKVRRHPRAFSV